MYTLILTVQSSHKDGGVSIHSIDFNDEKGACQAGYEWQDSLRYEPLKVNYVVVEKP